MSTRMKVLGVVIAVVVVGIAVLIVFVRPTPDDGTRDGKPSAPNPDGSTEVARDVASAVSRLESDPLSLVPEQDLDEVGERIGEAIPENSTVQADPTTWMPDGLGGGVIQVQVAPPGQAPQTYLAVMAQEDGEWKVLSTMLID